MDKAAAQAFTTDAQGRRVFLPFGPYGRAYVMPNLETETRLLKQSSRNLILAAVIGPASFLAFGFPLGLVACIVAVLGVYAPMLWSLRRFEVARGTLDIEAIRRESKHTRNQRLREINPLLIIVVGCLSLFLLFGGISMVGYHFLQDSDSLWQGVGTLALGLLLLGSVVYIVLMRLENPGADKD